MKTMAYTLLMLALSAATAAAHAQGYPARPVRLVVGFTPGGGVDINARLLASKLSEYFGQQVLVDNRPGAGTNIANEHVAKSPPDGYTLLVNTAAVAINMSLYKKLPFDTLRDFAPVSVFSMSPNILVIHPSVPVKNVKELLALARSKPGKLNFSSAGSGTTQHLSGELFKLRTKTDIVHVPYKGSAPSLTALIGGEVVVWYGVLAPANTPRDIVSTLSGAVIKATRSPDIKQRLLDQGAEPVGNTPEEFAKLLREEVAKWAEVVKVSGAKVD
ncbi:MAG: tripartite tricarboxylate transporter substrate binding protein [Burkholderiales bacterium]|nr:tripartite tricarboxylate transporter substrate binding protein [Burkholderiales bacterium]